MYPIFCPFYRCMCMMQYYYDDPPPRIDPWGAYENSTFFELKPGSPLFYGATTGVHGLPVEPHAVQ